MTLTPGSQLGGIAGRGRVGFGRGRFERQVGRAIGG